MQMAKENQVSLSILFLHAQQMLSISNSYIKKPIEWRSQIPEDKKANQAGHIIKDKKANQTSHIIINIVLVFGLPKEKQAKSNFLKNYLNYQIKVL